MKSIANILKEKIPRTPLLKGINAAQGVASANQALCLLFGKTIMDHAQVISLKNLILTIACLSPIVAQEIKFQEQRIVEITNSRLGFEGVKKITYIS